MIKRKFGYLFFLFTLVSLPVFSGDAHSEIEHLLTVIGQSNCTFIRNGKEHNSIDAEEHLRMKYRKGKKWIENADQFIERIASKSSLSGNPYFIRCEDSQQPTGEWLTRKLAEYRQSES